jgi:3-oxoacyl-[acyl-carrier-protein] synthase II
MGAISSLGKSVEEIWTAILRKEVGYSYREINPQTIESRFFGFVDLTREDMKKIPKGLQRQTPRFAHLSLLATQEAVQQAFGQSHPTDSYSPFECGVILGTGWGGSEGGSTHATDYRTTGFAHPFATLLSMASVATASTTMLYKLFGYQNTPIAACATGAIAVGEAWRIIREGSAKMVIAGGAEAMHDEYSVWTIDVLNALSREKSDVRKACCPFSKNRNGFILSEGAAVLVLEERESALARGATILAEITGYANYSDGHEFTAPAPDTAARTLTIKKALERAGLGPNQIDYINAHGTSTPLNDYLESLAIKRALGDFAYQTPMSSTKSYTGHLISAAGSLETIFCIKSIQERLIPATLHLDEPDEQCDLDFVPHEHRRPDKVDACLNLSFGFGGANAALIIERDRS